MNPLDEFPQIRRYLYLVQWVVNGILTVAGVVFLTLGTDAADLPLWYLLAVAVGPALWTYLGLTAQTNVPAGRHSERGSAGVLLGLGIAILVGVVLLLFGIRFR